LIDTIQIAQNLKASGLPQPQAEAIAQALLHIPESADLATKTDINLLRWMVGTNIVLTIAILARLFVK
jgi:hypothetical protein